MATNKEHREEKEKLLKSALPIGTVLGGHGADHEYKVVKVLGAGGFGITYKVSALIKVGNVLTKMFFVIKEHFFKGCDRDVDGMRVTCSKNMQEDFIQSKEDFIVEAERLNKLGNLSPNIVKVNEKFEANNTAYYVMEYLDGPNLNDMINEHGPMSETRAMSIINPIAGAVELLHNDHVLHLDIKPENIVMKTDASIGAMTPVLIDFGISKHFDKRGKPTSSLVAKGASDGFAPIEQYTEITTFAPEIDVYALGATMFFLLTGIRPKKAFYETAEDISSNLPSDVSARTRSAIINSMQQGPAERTKNVKTFLAALEQSSSLPLGYILHGATTNYQIVDVIMQSADYIQYRAILTSNDKAQSNETPVFQKYYIYEWFIKGKDKRNDDLNRQSESFNSNEDANRWLTHIKQVVDRDDLVGGLILPTQSDNIQAGCKLLIDNDKKIKAELFHSNGTLYLTCAIRKKPSVWRLFGSTIASCIDATAHAIVGIGREVAQNKKKVAIITGIFVLAGASYIGVNWYQNRPKPSLKEQLAEAINNKDIDELEDLAKDTVGAYAPLTQLYWEKKDTVNAQKYANMSKGIDTSANILSAIASKSQLVINKKEKTNVNKENIIDKTDTKKQDQEQSLVYPSEKQKTQNNLNPQKANITPIKDPKAEKASEANNVDNRAKQLSNALKNPSSFQNITTINNLAQSGYAPAYLPYAKIQLGAGRGGEAKTYLKKSIEANVNTSECSRLLKILE